MIKLVRGFSAIVSHKRGHFSKKSLDLGRKEAFAFRAMS